MDEPRRSGLALCGIAVGLACVALAIVGNATAARLPTLKERAAITSALPVAVRNYPVGCIWLDVRVASNGEFAKVVPQVFFPSPMACVRYASNGFYILRMKTRWHIVFEGSASPPCSLRIPRELLGSLGCGP